METSLRWKRAELDFPVCLLQTGTRKRNQTLPVDEHWQQHGASSSCCLAIQWDRRNQMQSPQLITARKGKGRLVSDLCPFGRRSWTCTDWRIGKQIPLFSWYSDSCSSLLVPALLCDPLPCSHSRLDMIFPPSWLAYPHFYKSLGYDLHLRQLFLNLHVNSFWRNQSYTQEVALLACFTS